VDNTFKRKLENSIIDDLKNNYLWSGKIQNDCKKQRVFLAPRNNLIDFYHKGGRLFCFDKQGFKTHIKYASVIPKTGKDYLTEPELSDYKLAADFKTNYHRIKENCSNYSGIEAAGVSAIYHKYSYLSDNNIVVLDIEVSFESFNEGKKQDRIDILLYKKDAKTLQFVEAKHYSNKEIWSRTTPKVINQINRYESQIFERRSEILSSYTEYVKILNSIFDKSLPEPTNIEDKVTLLIFGFDQDQKTGKLKKLITENSEYSGIKNYSIGNIKGVVMENFWNTKGL
jgi:hypothetical protein